MDRNAAVPVRIPDASSADKALLESDSPLKGIIRLRRDSALSSNARTLQLKENHNRVS